MHPPNAYSSNCCFNKLHRALQNSIREVGIDMTVSHEKKTKKVKCTTMNGPDCEKIMSKRGRRMAISAC